MRTWEISTRSDWRKPLLLVRTHSSRALDQTDSAQFGTNAFIAAQLGSSALWHQPNVRICRWAFPPTLETLAKHEKQQVLEQSKINKKSTCPPQSISEKAYNYLQKQTDLTAHWKSTRGWGKYSLKHKFAYFAFVLALPKTLLCITNWHLTIIGNRRIKGVG